MYERILIPTDGSDEAIKAAKHGIDLAGTIGATVHTLYVMDLPGVPRALSIRDDEEQVRREYKEFGERVTSNVAGMATDAGVECVSVIKTGTVHEEIVNYATREGMDLIVVGTGYQGRFGALLGTVAEKVVRVSSVPVTAVKMSEAESRRSSLRS